MLRRGSNRHNIRLVQAQLIVRVEGSLASVWMIAHDWTITLPLLSVVDAAPCTVEVQKRKPGRNTPYWADFRVKGVESRLFLVSVALYFCFPAFFDDGYMCHRSCQGATRWRDAQACLGLS